MMKFFSDSAEPKSNAELVNEHGINHIKGVKKARIRLNMVSNG